jgi:type VII secretion integral membrane protein EccD
MTTTGLVRVTIAAPRRRIDLALPERSPVAEILPRLLRMAGDGLADDGVLDGGWVLRRADGTTVDGARTLDAHQVRDGEVLHLVPRRTQWPEPEYDDLVDAIADGAGRAGRPWGPAHTQMAGLVTAGTAVALILYAIVRAGPPWPLPGLVALAVAVLLMAGGTVLARAGGDARSGAVLAALALPSAFAGGAMLLGAGLPLTEYGAPQLLSGNAALLLAAVLGYLGVVGRAAIFVGAAAVGLLGALASWAVTTEAVDATGAAAVVAGLVMVFSPLFTPVAARLGRLPMPVLPRTAADLVRDDPQPPRKAVYAAVLRTDALLTGLVWGGALAAIVAELTTLRTSSMSVTILLALLALGFSVRARLYPAIRQRVPLLAAGLLAVACLAIGPLMADREDLLVIAVPLLAVAAAAGVTAGLVYARRPPSPVLGRYSQLLEVVLVLACVPVVSAVLGLYGLVRGLGG